MSSGPHLTLPVDRLPPTTESLLDDSARPYYFLWWTDATVGQLKERLISPDLEERAYWIGALLREANSRGGMPMKHLRRSCHVPPPGRTTICKTESS